MNFCTNFSVSNYGVNRASVNRSNNVSFSGLFSRRGEHKDTERTIYGTTYGEERVAREEAAATKRMIQRETLRNSDDPSVREMADKVGENPFLDEYYTQREFDKYHERVMAERAIKEAKLAAAAGNRKYDGQGNYTIADKKGRIVESGKGNAWDTRYEYDIKYHVDRFGEHYTMNEAMKESRPDGTYVIKTSPNPHAGRLEEKFENGSVEYVDNCTGKIKSVVLPDGSSFDIPNRFILVKPTGNSRQYFSQYDDKTVQLEVFNDGTYVKA